MMLSVFCQHQKLKIHYSIDVVVVLQKGEYVQNNMKKKVFTVCHPAINKAPRKCLLFGESQVLKHKIECNILCPDFSQYAHYL